MILAVFAFPSFAGPNPSPGTLFPTATAVETGQAEISIGGAAGLMAAGITGGAFAGADLRVGYAPAPGLWTSASVLGFDGGTATAFGDATATTAGGVSLAGAWDLARRPELSTGPVFGTTVLAPGLLVTPALGWSVSAGRSVRWDATLVVNAAIDGTTGNGLWGTGLEAGAWFRAERPDRFRVGVLGTVLWSEEAVLPLPALDLVYRHQEERWYLEAGTTGILVLQGVRLEAGVRF